MNFCMNVLVCSKKCLRFVQVFSCQRFNSYVEFKLEPNFLPSLYDTEKEENKRIREIKRLKSHQCWSRKTFFCFNYGRENITGEIKSKKLISLLIQCIWIEAIISIKLIDKEQPQKISNQFQLNIKFERRKRKKNNRKSFQF